MIRRPLLRLALTLGALAAAGALLASRVELRTDLGFFLPHDVSPAMRPLLEGLRDGPAAGLILVGLSGAPEPELARASDGLAQALEASGLFRLVANGRLRLPQAELDLLLEHRYVLDPPVAAADFTEAALRRDLEEALASLTGIAAPLVQRFIAADPTGRMRRIGEIWAGGLGPPRRHGVWFSRDGGRALLLLRARAAGFDLAGQQAAVAAIRARFAELNSGDAMRLDLSGPSVFAAEISQRIGDESWLLTLASALIAGGIVLAAFRAPALVLAMGVPPAAGMIAGAAAVQAVFGHVHGMALGFGSILLGVAIDYPLHLAGHTARGTSPWTAARRVWPTLRLAVATTALGFLPMTLTSLPGLSQLGVFALTGLPTAGLLTRWVLPALLPPVPAPPLRRWERLLGAADALGRHRGPLLLLAAAGAVVLVLRGGVVWQSDLNRLSPLPESSRRLDAALRADLGAPDVRVLLAVAGGSPEEVLQRSEDLAPDLRALVGQGVLAGFDMAARYLPSRRAQEQRRAALPEPERLRAALTAAGGGLPFRDGLFAPFLADVERARTAPPLDLETLSAGGLGWRVESLLWPAGEGWVGLIVPRGIADGEALAAFARDRAAAGVLYFDLKRESERLVAGYRDEALGRLGWGAALTLAVLWAGLRRPEAVLRVAAPVALAVVLTVAALAASGAELSLFHLVSLLLVTGLGLDYALFFHRYSGNRDDRVAVFRTLVLCNATTVGVFAVMAFSSQPVLSGIGTTVALGTALSLLFGCSLTARPAPISGP